MGNIKNCRSCGNELPGKSLFKQPGMPNAVQNLPASKEKALAVGIILEVKQCNYCDLVQLTNEPVPYYRDTIRAGSFSPSMLERQRNEFKSLIKRFDLEGKNVIEIGSGRGEYLQLLNELPINAFGMENNQECCRIAQEKGLKIYQTYPNNLNGPVDDILFDGLVSINFLEHAPEPGEFLKSCGKILSEDGIGMIAVPDFEFELNDNFLFSFMIDHLCYFSVNSLRNLLSLNGFKVIEAFRNKKLNVVTTYFRKRKVCNLTQTIKQTDEFSYELNHYMDAILSNDGKIALWGASHLAFSIISISNTANKFSYIVDSAFFKQGKFAPVSGLEIFPPEYLLEDPVDTIIIMCPEFSDEIFEGIKQNFPQLIKNIATFKNGKLDIIK